jgi:hypothetical protein
MRYLILNDNITTTVCVPFFSYHESKWTSNSFCIHAHTLIHLATRLHIIVLNIQKWQQAAQQKFCASSSPMLFRSMHVKKALSLRKYLQVCRPSKGHLYVMSSTSFIFNMFPYLELLAAWNVHLLSSYHGTKMKVTLVLLVIIFP